MACFRRATSFLISEWSNCLCSLNIFSDKVSHCLVFPLCIYTTLLQSHAYLLGHTNGQLLSSLMQYLFIKYCWCIIVDVSFSEFIFTLYLYSWTLSTIVRIYKILQHLLKNKFVNAFACSIMMNIETLRLIVSNTCKLCLVMYSKASQS